MTFEEYQKQSRFSAQYPILGSGVVYPTLGLAGETGEVVEKIKKIFRDNKGGVADEASLLAIKKELGDVLWYMAQIATELNISLDDVATHNMEKLKARVERGTIHGSGDER
jgi:NTP pyrophosphatase (non-canonical NTP hydrolase)